MTRLSAYPVEKSTENVFKLPSYPHIISHKEAEVGDYPVE